MNNIMRFFCMAALVATGAILSGCSKKEVEEPEDDETENEDEDEDEAEHEEKEGRGGHAGH